MSKWTEHNNNRTDKSTNTNTQLYVHMQIIASVCLLVLQPTCWQPPLLVGLYAGPPGRDCLLATTWICLLFHLSICADIWTSARVVRQQRTYRSSNENRNRMENQAQAAKLAYDRKRSYLGVQAAKCATKDLAKHQTGVCVDGYNNIQSHLQPGMRTANHQCDPNRIKRQMSEQVMDSNHYNGSTDGKRNDQTNWQHIIQSYTLKSENKY